MPTTHHDDIFMGYGYLVAILVGMHVVAFLFWIYMVSKPSRASKKTKRAQD